MSKLARPITPDEIKTYHEAGVVLLRGILDLKTVNTLRQSIDEAIARLKNSPSGYDFSKLVEAFEADDDATLQAQSDGQHDITQVTNYMRQSGDPLLRDEEEHTKPGRFLLDTGVSSRQLAFKKLTQRGALAELAGTLLQAETTRYFGDQVFVKEAGTRERTAFHQDATYFEIEGDDCCVLWAPADPVTINSGGMEYVRGSHKDGRLYQPNVFVSQTPLPGAQGERLPDIENNRDNYDIVSFDVEPGDVIVHHFRTIHGTGGNHSEYQVRRAASVRYCGDDIRYLSRPWAPKQTHQTHTLKPGDPLSGSNFPIVWRQTKQDVAA